MSSYVQNDVEWRGGAYRSLRRPIDDPELNFQKIRDKKLWLKHEIAKQRLERLAAPPVNTPIAYASKVPAGPDKTRAGEPGANPGEGANFTGNVVAERRPQLKDRTDAKTGSQ